MPYKAFPAWGKINQCCGSLWQRLQPIGNYLCFPLTRRNMKVAVASVLRKAKQRDCSMTETLGQKDQAKAGGRMPLWHLSIPILRNE
eukprot:450327-Pelagomonas_calceolata.AAC.1